MAPPQLGALGVGEQPRGVSADGLEQREARLAVAILAAHQQALVEQRRQQIERLDLVGAVGGVEAHGQHRRRAEGAAEDAQPPEQPALRLAQQVVAPVERRAQRAVAVGQVGGAAGEQAEAVVEPAQHRLRRQQPHARRGELDGERQPVEPPAELGDGPGVAAVEREVGHQRPGAADEQRHRGVAGELARAAAGSRDRAARAAAAAGRARRAGAATSRLVASTLSPAAPASSRATAGPAATTCSRLSSTSSSRRGRSHSASASSDGRSPSSLTPSTSAMAAGTALGIADSGERHQPDAVGQLVEQRRRRLHGQPRLADAAGSGEHQQPHLGAAQHLDGAHQLLVAAVERSGGERQVVARRRRRGLAAQRLGDLDPRPGGLACTSDSIETRSRSRSPSMSSMRA